MQGKFLVKRLPNLSSQLNDYSQTLILQRSRQGMNFSMPLLNLYSVLYGCEIWRPELLSYKTHFDKSTIEQVHIKFCKQTLNVPWYTENKACRAELGLYL